MRHPQFEITVRNTSVAFVGLRPAIWHSYTLLSTFAAVANVETLDLTITEVLYLSHEFFRQAL